MSHRALLYSALPDWQFYAPLPDKRMASLLPFYYSRSSSRCKGRTIQNLFAELQLEKRRKNGRLDHLLCR